MRRFSLNSDDLFIASHGGCIDVWKTDKLHEPLLNISDWTKIVMIYPDSGDELEVFNIIIKGPKLKRLMQALAKCNWSTNREGFMYLYAQNFGHFRINDFFGWSKYGVYPTVRTTWNKLEMNSKRVVVDIVEKDKLLTVYEETLEEKEKELLSCKMELEEMEKHLASDMEEECVEISSSTKKSNDYFSDFEVSLMEKLKIMENELYEAKKSLDEKHDDMEVTEARLKLKERELMVLMTLWERHLGISEETLYKQRDDTCLPKKEEEELKKVSSELIAEEKKVSAFRAALKCLVRFLEDVNVSLRKDFDYEIMLGVLSDEKHVDLLRGLEGGATVSQISATLLQIVEQQNYSRG